MKYFLPFNPSNIACMSPRPPLSDTKSLLSSRQSMHSRRVPSFFFTHKHWAAHGDMERRITPRSTSCCISALIMRRSSGEKRRCLAAKGVQNSLINGSSNSPFMQAGTRFGSMGNRPSSMKAASTSTSCCFLRDPNVPMLTSSTRTRVLGSVGALASLGGAVSRGSSGGSDAAGEVSKSDSNPG